MGARTAALLAFSLWPGALAAQRGIELGYARWDPDRTASIYRLAFTRDLTAKIAFALTGTATIDDSLGRRRAFYGGGFELSLLKGRRVLGPYVVAGVELGLITDTAAHALGLAWSGGVGLEWQPLDAVALQVETRVRATDRGPKGFWNLASGSPSGLGIGAGLAVRWGGGGAGGSRSGSAWSSTRPLAPPSRISGSAADVVRTALEAVGTPYKWGGSAENGFDCSGLIQFAYGQHGFALPRVSRDQMRVGYEMPLDTLALQPGDILGFAAVPGRGVSHVGMWVGEGKFIHSSNSGVRLSQLNPYDPDGKWFWTRWVGVRRVVR